MKKKNKNALFGRYPSCDHCNNALRFIANGKPDEAFREIVHAIQAADGYFHEDVADTIETLLLVETRCKSKWPNL